MAMISLKSIYQRITFNKTCLAFFLFCVVQCLAQVIIGSLMYSVDSKNSALVTRVIGEAEVPRREIAWLTGNPKEFKLHLCTNIPFGVTDNFCTTAFDSHHGNFSIPVAAGFRRSMDGIRLPRQSSIAHGLTIDPMSNSSSQMNGVNVSLLNGTTIFLDEQCTRLLVYPYQIFRAFVREDAALIVFQFWLVCIGFFVIVYESKPHLLATLVARTLVTIWSSYSTWRSGQIANYISHLMIGPTSPCDVDMFPTYFRTRIAYEISMLVVNAVGLLFSIFLSFKLLKMFCAQARKNIDPSKEIIQIYRLFLGFFVCLQLTAFFLAAAMSLWINELIYGAISQISTSSHVYHGLFIATTSLLLPWTAMGWFAVRHEIKKLLAVFLFLGIFYITSWGVMFYSQAFRWTFASWPFFASLTVAAFVMLIASFVLGVICRKNFDKGLAHFLYVEDVLGKANFHPGVFTNDANDVERVSLDSMRIASSKGTKFVVPTNAIFL